MAVLTPNPATGQAIYEGSQDFREHDDRLDKKSAGVYVHDATELSATEFEEVLDVLRYTIAQLKGRFPFSELTDVDVTGINPGDMMIWSGTEWQPSSPTDTDEKVKLNAEDTTAGYLADKVDNVTIIANEGGTIQVGTIGNDQIAADAAIAWSKVDVSLADPSDIGAADADHDHAADEITSGNLAIERIALESINELTGNPALAASAHGKTYVNLTATRKDPTLPAAAAGLRVRFMALHSDGVRIVAAAGDRIRYAADVTTADTGYLQGTATGNVVELVAVDTTNWIVISAVGSWTLTAS